MRAWAAPVIDGARQDHLEIEVPTEGTRVMPHTLPWPEIGYRYEYEPGEQLPVVQMTSVRTTDEEIMPGKLRRRWWHR